VKRVSLHCGDISSNEYASIGIGSLIIFIAMIITAGVTASVIFQTMDSMQQQALRTSQETIKDISTGLKISHISGYIHNSSITKLVFFVETIAGSDAVDLAETTVQLSDSETVSILHYDNTTFSSSVTNGLFGSVNSSNLSNIDFSVLVIRDIDSSCTSSNPVINKNDLVAILVNTTSCFSGISNSISVSGRIMPEQGISATIGFTTPSSFTTTIIDLR